jgi:hypothetical protein
MAEQAFIAEDEVVQVVVVPMVLVDVTVDRITVKVLRNRRAPVSSIWLSLADCACMTAKTVKNNTAESKKRIFFNIDEK